MNFRVKEMQLGLLNSLFDNIKNIQIHDFDSSHLRLWFLRFHHNYILYQVHHLSTNDALHVKNLLPFHPALLFEHKDTRRSDMQLTRQSLENCYLYFITSCSDFCILLKDERMIYIYYGSSIIRSRSHMR